MDNEKNLSEENVTKVKVCDYRQLNIIVAQLKMSYPFVVGSIKTSTCNLGDHFQILAMRYLLAESGLTPEIYIDRDDEIASCQKLMDLEQKVLLVLNGWFKTNLKQWPPHEKIIPLFIGFHIRLFQCPTLMSDEAIEYYKKYQPIGCRDPYTLNLLANKGVNCYLSYCLTLTLSPRPIQPESELIMVASRTTEILEILPGCLKNIQYVNHYTSTHDFDQNIVTAENLLARYRTEPTLVITTFLHSALVCLALSIPVVVFYPKPYNLAQKQSDRERFSCLDGLIRIYNFEEINDVNFQPSIINVDTLRQRIRCQFSLELNKILRQFA